MPESSDVVLPRIELASRDLADQERALRTEWLVTNGLGGYASSTVLGVNTRKYHGLLLASFNPPVDRRLFLAKLDEEVQLGNAKYIFGVNENTQGILPQGHRLPVGFALNPFPMYTYGIDQALLLRKTIFMPRGENASIILYEVSNKSHEAMRISITPLVNARNFHSVTLRDQINWRFVQKPSDQGVVIAPSTGHSALRLFSNTGHYKAGTGEWVEMHYRTEASRGESSHDFCYKPGSFDISAESGETKNFCLIAVAGKDESTVDSAFSLTWKDSKMIAELYESELKRQRDLLRDFSAHHRLIEAEDWLKWLILAADSFVVNRDSIKAKSVIAGYHWFNDWGRDSLIALPGLTLVTQRFDDARQILLTFAHYCREGLVPNAFPDSSADQPAYNTVDATLWFLNAVLQYLKYTNDFQFVEERLWPTMESIIECYRHGTRFGIRLDDDCLITHGPQLTWMDAAPDGKPVTPREGKAVEIQALWFNALKTMHLLARRLGQNGKAEVYHSMSEKTQHSFSSKFWNAQKNCLFDLIGTDNSRDDSLRPNQVIAAALDFTMLSHREAGAIIDSVWKHLHTPCGLRTLVASDPRYVGRYEGNRWQRDASYHNGTVWPWLAGPFTAAFLKLKNHEEPWRLFALDNFLKPLVTQEIYRAGLGFISEIADGDPPHESKGCIAQAWSVAEVLRAYTEDILLRRPAYESHVLASGTSS